MYIVECSTSKTRLGQYKVVRAFLKSILSVAPTLALCVTDNCVVEKYNNILCLYIYGWIIANISILYFLFSVFTLSLLRFHLIYIYTYIYTCTYHIGILTSLYHRQSLLVCFIVQARLIWYPQFSNLSPQYPIYNRTYNTI